MTEAECHKEVRALAEYYHSDVSDMQLGVWFQVFGKQPLDLFQESVRHHWAHAGYGGMPSPGTINEALDRVREARALKVRHEPPAQTADEYTDKREWELAAAITGEILTWHRLGLVDAQRQEFDGTMDAEEWVRAGKPKTWSPMVDHYFEGLSHMRGSAQRKEFMAGYLATLRKTRAERTQPHGAGRV